MVDIQKKSSAYILATGKDGTSNLDLQHEILKQESFAQLKEAGLAKTMTIWDIGCGSGVMTAYLADRVGEEGVVYAMDASEAQIKVAQERIQSKGYKNVKFIIGDVNNLDNSKYEKADIVYSRFLLMHVSHPEEVINIMASLLKTDGKLCLHESTMNSIKENNTNPFLNKYYSLMIDYGKLKGFNYNIGRELPAICSGLNIFSKITHYTKNYATGDDIKKLLSLRFDELKDKLISSNLITEEEYIKLKMDINNYLFTNKECESSSIMAELSHIIAYKENK